MKLNINVFGWTEKFINGTLCVFDGLQKEVFLSCALLITETIDPSLNVCKI